MDEAERVRRAASFGTAARAYAEHRPPYPDAALTWALEPVRSRRIVRVLDLGAGTGLITEALRRIRVDVVAVEPDAAMRAVMLERVYGVAVLAGSAEHIPLPDGRVDAVVVGQAFHWFDQHRAYPEIVRVLNAGGVLSVMWNTEDPRVPWVAQYAQHTGFAPRYEPPADLGFTRDAPLGDHSAFERPEWASFPHSYRRTVDSLLKTVSTYSGYLVMPRTERVKRLGRIREYLLSRPETAGGEFDLPLITRVGRVIRR